MRVYLAGPMRGYPRYNVDTFYAAAERLRADGHHVWSPAEHDVATGFDPDGPLDGFSLTEAMRWDIGRVLRAEAVVVLPGWRQSEGCGLEVAVARAVDTPVLAYPDLAPVRPEPVTMEARRLVHGARQAAYGHPADDFTRTGRMWGAILGIPDVAPETVGLCMAAVKISREVNSHARDNLVDLCGYAETISLVHDRKESS